MQRRAVVRATFSFLWACDALVAAIVLWFFAAGIADGSVSSFNAGIWAAVLAAVGTVVGGSLWLRQAGYVRLGVALLLVLAVPAGIYALFIVAVVVSGTPWN